jgi:hypothetical protein
MKSPDDPLLNSTLRSTRKSSGGKRATLPCLTVLGHRDRARMGERAALKALLIGQAVEVSRAAPKFGKPGGAPEAPLADPHLSRSPFRLRATADGGVIVEPNGRAAHRSRCI